MLSPSDSLRPLSRPVNHIILPTTNLQWTSINLSHIHRSHSSTLDAYKLRCNVNTQLHTALFHVKKTAQLITHIYFFCLHPDRFVLFCTVTNTCNCFNSHFFSLQTSSRNGILYTLTVLPGVKILFTLLLYLPTSVMQVSPSPRLLVLFFSSLTEGRRLSWPEYTVGYRLAQWCLHTDWVITVCQLQSSTHLITAQQRQDHKLLQPSDLTYNCHLRFHNSKYKPVIFPNSFSCARVNISLYNISACLYLPCFRYADACK